MRTYWDLSERERGELTQEGVEKYIDAELMVKGVLCTPPLELVPVPEVKLGTVAAYFVEGFDGVAFNDEASANKFLALQPSMVERNWRLDNIESFKAPRARPSIVSRQIAHAQAVSEAETLLQQASDAKTENSKRQREYDEAKRKERDVLKGLWEDWHERTGQVRQMQRILDTFEKYVKLAEGDEKVARKFLCQAFTGPELDAAEAWFDRQLGPHLDEVHVPPVRLVEEPKTDSEGLGF